MTQNIQRLAGIFVLALIILGGAACIGTIAPVETIPTQPTDPPTIIEVQNTATPMPQSADVVPPTTTPQPTTTVTPVSGGELDPFSITKINMTVPGGREWFAKWDQGEERIYVDDGSSNTWDPLDSQLLLMNGNATYTIYGNSTERAGQMRVFGPVPRIYVRGASTTSTPAPDTLKWNNVEVTFYAYSTGDSPEGYAGLEAVVKTDHWVDGIICQTRGYGGRILFDGRADFEKEVCHHCKAGANVQAAEVRPWGKNKMPLKRWLGYKYVARDMENNTKVKLELYIDRTSFPKNVVNPEPPANGGNWELLTTFIDDGTWSTQAMACEPGFDPGEVLTEANWSIYLRTDGISEKKPQYYKWFSVREVAPLP